MSVLLSRARTQLQHTMRGPLRPCVSCCHHSFVVLPGTKVLLVHVQRELCTVSRACLLSGGVCVIGTCDRDMGKQFCSLVLQCRREGAGFAVSS